MATSNFIWEMYQGMPYIPPMTVYCVEFIEIASPAMVIYKQKYGAENLDIFHKTRIFGHVWVLIIYFGKPSRGVHVYRLAGLGG